MDGISPELTGAFSDLWSHLNVFRRQLMTPLRGYQLLGIIGLWLAAWLMARLAEPRLRDWLREQEGWPKWRLRLGLLVAQRLRLIFFALLAWAIVLIMREVTWNSRSQLIGLAAKIATAWLVIEFGVRIIANRFLRRLVRWLAWVWVTLYFLGLLAPMTQFLDSLAVTFGDFRLSALTVLKALIVTGAMISGARLLSGLLSTNLSRNDDISPSMRVLISKLVQIVLFSLALIIGLKAVGFDLTGLAVFSGAVGLGLGFGLQKVVSNLVSGVIILLDKSVKPGDVISLGDTFGWIEQLGARYVSVVTRDGKEYLIPNEDLVTGQVVNWSHTNDFVRLDLRFGASYADDPHEVSRIAIEAARSVSRVLSARAPVCWITGFGDSSVDYVLRFWITDASGGLTNVRGLVFLALWDAFKSNGISVPFPQREVRLLNEELPRFAPAPAPEAEPETAPDSGGKPPAGA